MADYPGAIDYFVDRSRVFANQNSHSAIVLHGTGGDANQTAQQLGDYFCTNNLITSVHYGIDRAGTICQYVLEQDGAAGNCCTEPGYDPFWNQFNGDNLNLHTISIEHENDASNSLAPTPAMKDASFKLVAYLCKKYAIPVANIKTHASIAPSTRARCPGNYPIDELKAYIQGANVNTPPQGWPLGWTDDGHTLTAPNGHKVVGGFRQFIYSNFWDNDDFPLEEEHPVSPLELGNLGLGNGTQQIFRKTILEIPPGRGIVKMWTGQEVQASRKALATQQGKLIALQNVYNAVVAEKNGLVAEVAQLKQQLAAANATSVLQLQQQLTSLQGKINQAKADLS